MKGRDVPAGATWRKLVVVSLSATAQERLAKHESRLAADERSVAPSFSPHDARVLFRVARYLRDNPEVLDLLDEVEQ